MNFYAAFCDVAAILWAIASLRIPREGFVKGFAKGMALAHLVVGIYTGFFV